MFEEFNTQIRGFRDMTLLEKAGYVGVLITISALVAGASYVRRENILSPQTVWNYVTKERVQDNNPDLEKLTVQAE